MSIVLCKMPKAGLGNQLFPIMRALVFGNLNQLEVIIIGYNQIKMGPYLRREKSKRKYFGAFRFQKNILGEWIDQLKLSRYSGLTRMEEPPLISFPLKSGADTIYVYSALPDYRDFFSGLNQHRVLVKQLLFESLSSKVILKLNELKSPCIGVHIRMGDFKILADGQDFSQVGQTRTPEKYFIDVINSIRSIHQSALPVTVFSNGYENELPELFRMPGVSMMEGNTDIVDLLLLSRSKIIVTSSGSTFSYWSGFLSNAPVIMHPDHLYKPCRLPQESPELYEGPMDTENPILLQAIRQIEY